MGRARSRAKEYLRWRPAARGRLAAALAGAVTALFATPDAALASPGSPFTPRSPQADAILGLFVVVLILSALVFVLVEAWLFLTVFRYRRRPGDGVPRQVGGNRRVEIAWTAVPVLLLMLVFVLMVPALAVLDPPPPTNAAAPSLRVTVIGHQWWWEYRYPDLHIVTANELHIPTGTPVLLEIRSDDVIHSYWVPELNGKIDAVPGKVNHLTFFARDPGRYGGQCSEFCGIQHAWMLNPVFADPPDQFEAWVRGQQAPADPADSVAVAGKARFLQSTCINCHAVAGTEAQARVGPDLSHLGGRTTLGAGVLTNTPENLALWINHTHDVKPGARMPGFNFGDQETRELVAYLSALK